MSFMELSMDFKVCVGTTLPSAPQAVYRGETLPLPKRARLLKPALAIRHMHLQTGRLFSGGVLTKCIALVPLGGPMVVGRSVRPYFMSPHDIWEELG